MMPSLGSYSWCNKRRRTGPNAIVPMLGNQHQVDNAVHSNCQGVDSAPVIIDLDLDTFDDDIAISSARAFAEAKSNTRRHRAQTVVIDLDSEGRSSSVAQTCKKHMSRELVNADPVINLATSNCKSLEKERAITTKQPTFNCPVCLGPLVEEMSTKCGHIFCKKCIKTAIHNQKMCPTCRKKMTMRTVFRVYLPSITY